MQQGTPNNSTWAQWPKNQKRKLNQPNNKTKKTKLRKKQQKYIALLFWDVLDILIDNSYNKKYPGMAKNKQKKRSWWLVVRTPNETNEKPNPNCDNVYDDVQETTKRTAV